MSEKNSTPTLWIYSKVSIPKLNWFACAVITTSATYQHRKRHKFTETSSVRTISNFITVEFCLLFWIRNILSVRMRYRMKRWSNPNLSINWRIVQIRNQSILVTLLGTSVTCAIDYWIRNPFAVVFQHIPFFLQHPDEEDNYSNIEKEVRLPMLEKLYNLGQSKAICDLRWHH